MKEVAAFPVKKHSGNTYIIITSTSLFSFSFSLQNHMDHQSCMKWNEAMIKKNVSVAKIAFAIKVWSVKYATILCIFHLENV